ncbi:GAK system CofD-like protein [Candidatus Uabimicrobium sp. HlEnr_7]|uniref:GAK system CofD-like protein n=1 Tax=Candidatus Uabimicrobium helgolandensis TaxID=3095367 RepID=UPI0035578B0F
MIKVTVTRTIEIPDTVKLERYRRSPELGPKILFFSGGSALKKLSQQLIRYTHNSIHLITPFDSGGSSATLRQAFEMIAVGDLRNRLMALADQSVRGAPEIYELFGTRFSQDPNEILIKELHSLVDGSHYLVKNISNPMRKIIRYNLQFFAQKMTKNFPLQGANIGNLILVGGYLNYNRNIDSVIFLFSKLVEVRGVVRPIIGGNYHLATELENGQFFVGQHLITGKETPEITSPIKRIYLTKSLDSKKEVQPTIHEKIKNTIKKAELICYPMGSFYSSLIAHFIPQHTATAIAQNSCPKILILNYGKDPEQLGMTPSSTVKMLLSYLQRDFSKEVPTHKLLNFVLLDSSSHQSPDIKKHIQIIQEMGLQVIDISLISESSKPLLDANKLIDILLSFI